MKKRSRKVCRNSWLLRPFRLMSGRLDSNQRPPEPHIGGLTAWITAKSVRGSHPAVCGFHVFDILQVVRPGSRLIPEFPGYSLPFPATVTGCVVRIETMDTSKCAHTPHRTRLQPRGCERKRARSFRRRPAADQATRRGREA